MPDIASSLGPPTHPVSEKDIFRRTMRDARMQLRICTVHRQPFDPAHGARNASSASAIDILTPPVR